MPGENNSNPTTDPTTNPNTNAGNPPVGVQEPVVQPAPAQGANPTSEPAGEGNQPPVSTGVEVASYEPTGNAAMDFAIGYISKRGLTMDTPEVAHAYETGDFSQLRVLLAERGDDAKAYGEVIDMAEAAYDTMMAAHNAQVAAQDKMILDAVGGEDTYRQMAEWATANWSQEERDEYNSMLAQGGIQAKAAVTLLHNVFSGASTVSKAPESAVGPNASTSGVSGSGALSREAYQQAVQALKNQMGYPNIEHTQEFKALEGRRLQGIKAGI